MGTYDDLLTLQNTPAVASPEPSKTVETPAEILEQPKPQKPAVKAAPKPPMESKPVAVLAVPMFKKRNITRGSFEVYQDQLHVLRQVSLTAKLTGEDLSISEMVREALDEYIHAKDLRP